MPDVQTIAERVAVVESKLDDTRAAINTLSSDVKQLNYTLENARGARWMALAVFSLAASFGAIVASNWAYLKRVFS